MSFFVLHQLFCHMQIFHSSQVICLWRCVVDLCSMWMVCWGIISGVHDWWALLASNSLLNWPTRLNILGPGLLGCTGLWSEQIEFESWLCVCSLVSRPWGRGSLRPQYNAAAREGEDHWDQRCCPWGSLRPQHNAAAHEDHWDHSTTLLPRVRGGEESWCNA